MWHSIIERWKGLVPAQQISVVILGFCGSLALGLSVYRVRENVYAPFLVDKGIFEKAKSIVGLTDEQIVEQQKRRDTDGDGLSDWDESNRFRTNPDLYDSCGDGQPDNIRVVTGKNVLCTETGVNLEGRLDLKVLRAEPTKGQLGAVPNPNDAQMFDKDFFQEVSQTIPGFNVTGTNAVDENGKPNPGLARDPALIREVLRGQIDPNMLDQITDEQLLKIFDESVAKQWGTSTSTQKQTP